MCLVSLPVISTFQFTLPHGERHNSDNVDARSALVSIHAPAWGATPGLHSSGGVFNVSIHAPAWGATRRGGGCASTAMFQFTLPHGERQIPNRFGECKHKFQFTLPHGERLELLDLESLAKRFNSRSRMGSDLPFRAYALIYNVSIHAPAWGATFGVSPHSYIK